jgi:exodeoxyribonuclease VIII
MLKSMAKGWRQFEAEHILKTASRKETDAMRLGTAIHAAILEPEKYAEAYAIVPDECSDRRTKAWKEWVANNLNKLTVTSAEAALIAHLCRQVARCKTAATILGAVGEAETEHTWESLGVDCRAKIDWRAGGIIADIKTCDDATESQFARTIASYRYDLQAVHYLDGTKADRFIFIAIETSSPYRVRCYELCDTDRQRAEFDRADLLTEYAQRKAANDWSEQGENDLRTIFLPNWRA